MYLALGTCAAAAEPPVIFRLCAAPSLVGMCCLVMPSAVDVCCGSRARSVCTQVGAGGHPCSAACPHSLHDAATALVWAVFWCQAPWTCAAAAGPNVSAPSARVLSRKPDRRRDRDADKVRLLPFFGWCRHYLVCFHVLGAVDVCCGSRTHCACTLCMRDRQDARQLANGGTHHRIFCFSQTQIPVVF